MAEHRAGDDMIETAGSSGQPLDVLIVGAGISGIGMAAHLAAKCPTKRFAIVERRARVGGTWDLFRYPGIRSDSDMSTLAYEFEPWRDEKVIAGGEDIRAYIASVADTRGIAGHIRFGLKAVAAAWDGKTALWTLTVEDEAGQRNAVRARFLFLGSGYYDYDQPHDPGIPGIAGFGGTVVHPQFWPENLDHAGKRVVVIGSGATAATLVPAMTGAAAHVTLLQRTPSWYFTRPSADRLGAWLQRWLPGKLGYALTCWKNLRLQDYLVRQSRKEPEKMKAHLHKQIGEQLGVYDPADFTPPYDPWNQRMCLIPDGDLFAALKSGKAEMVTGQIAAVDRDGVRLEDGRHIAADIIVTATGLRLAAFGGMAITVDGVPLSGAEHFYYRNCMLSNVPNFAAMFGYLNAAWTLRVDLVSGWLCRLLNEMDAQGAHVATPVLAADHQLVESDPFAILSSGYLQRGRHLIPKSAVDGPWRIGMHYFTDRKEMRSAPIDDGIMRLDKAPASG
jgi:cation diffusion facilitator CzcD-associated flavoprotein CzcO